MMNLKINLVMQQMLYFQERCQEQVQGSVDF